jgi:hypothetical protein
MNANMRISVRQRYPESNKALKIFRTYERYAHFEAEMADVSHIKGDEGGTERRVGELQQESARTLEALKQKQPVRIPEMKGKEKVADAIDTSKVP